MDNNLVCDGRWCVPTSPVHHLVADYQDALHLTTYSVEEHWKEINHGVEDEGLYKAVELQCQTRPSCAIHTHDTKRKQGYRISMPIPMEPMDSIALDVFHYSSVKGSSGQDRTRLISSVDLCIWQGQDYSNYV